MIKKGIKDKDIEMEIAYINDKIDETRKELLRLKTYLEFLNKEASK